MGEVRADSLPGGKGGGGEIHCPENHSGCIKVNTPGSEDTTDLGPVACEVAARLWYEPAEDQGAALRSSDIVEAGAGVEVMAAAGASANGGALAAAAVGQDVATSTDD